MTVHLIAYLSEYTGPEDDAYVALGDIMRTAKAENPKYGITGVLFFIDMKYLQIIEGEEAALRQLMTNIEKDLRNASIQYLVDTEVEERGFGKWNMDSFPLDGRHTFDAATLRELTESFAKNMVMRSDVLTYYYKTLLAQKVA